MQVDRPVTMNKQQSVIKLSGYAGLLPFIGTLAGLFLTSGEIKEYFLKAFIAYSAVIISFIGAVHWGFILKSQTVERAERLLAFAVIPSLVGWMGLLGPTLFSLVVFAAGFPCLYIYERHTKLRQLLPEWYMGLRLRLTILVTSMQILAIAGNL